MMKEFGYETTDEALKYAEKYFEEKAIMGFNSSMKKRMSVDEEISFSNARMVRNFLETAIMNKSDRLYREPSVANKELCMIEDVRFIA